MQSPQSPTSFISAVLTSLLWQGICQYKGCVECFLREHKGGPCV
jgi:hypothetical protein